MTYPGSREPRLRVVAIGDADSFVKWAAHLVDRVDDISQHLLLVRTPLTVSDAQKDAAIAGTRFAEHPKTVMRIAFADVADWLARDLPDVVVLAGRAPFVRLMSREIDRLTRRPVVVSGLPGMSIPCGFGQGDKNANRPVGLQLIGTYFEEAKLLNVAHQFQLATDWHRRAPAGL